MWGSNRHGLKSNVYHHLSITRLRQRANEIECPEKSGSTNVMSTLEIQRHGMHLRQDRASQVLDNCKQKQIPAMVVPKRLDGAKEGEVKDSIGRTMLSDSHSQCLPLKGGKPWRIHYLGEQFCAARW